MTAVVGAVVGLLAAFGLVLVVAAIAGYEIPRLPQASNRSDRDVIVDPKLVAAGVAAGVVSGVMSGLLAVGFLVCALIVAFPLFRAARAERELLIDRTEALAEWAESLRDQVRSHAGLRQAIVTSLATVRPVIRADVVRLAEDLETDDPAVALQGFAGRVGDPVGDLLAAALTVALGSSGARDMPALLGQLALDARDEVTGIRQTAVHHEKTFGTARSMAIVVGLTSVAMFAMNRDYVAQYRQPAGQVVLTVVVAAALVAVASLVRMARPTELARVLAPGEVMSS